MSDSRMDSVLESMRDNLVELRMTNQQISKLIDVLQTNLKSLNDSFIMHQSETREQHDALHNDMQELCERNDRTTKWLIVALIVALGATEVATKII